MPASRTQVLPGARSRKKRGGGLTHFGKHRLEDAKAIIGDIIARDFQRRFKLAVLDGEAIGDKVLDVTPF